MSVKIDGFHEAPNSGGTYDKNLLVAHVTISPEVEDAALGVIRNWVKTRSGSTQYVVDDKHIQQAVREQAYAWAAGTTANKAGIHVEHVGFMQNVAQWDDDYSKSELALSAALFADLAHKYDIPVRLLTVEQIRHAAATGKPEDGGICFHADITKAFPGETTHTDAFPPKVAHRWLEQIKAEHAAQDKPAVHQHAGAHLIAQARQQAEDAVHSLWLANQRLRKADGHPKAQGQIEHVQHVRHELLTVLDRLPGGKK